MDDVRSTKRNIQQIMEAALEMASTKSRIKTGVVNAYEAMEDIE